MGELLGRLARPTPEKTHFVEVRFSTLLTAPLVVSGELEFRSDGTLVRRVLEPYEEVTELTGDHARIERAGAPPRQFALDRTPELRGMMASLGGLLRGDRAEMERYFDLVATGNDGHWLIRLTPRGAKLRKHVQSIDIVGKERSPRCFTMLEPDGDSDTIAIGMSSPTKLPAPLEQSALERWCVGPN